MSGCGIFHAPSGSSNQASTLLVAFKQGATYKYHYHSRLNATIAVGQGFSLPIKADTGSDATWKIVSVDASGNTTVHVTLSNLQSSYGLTPSSTTTTTTQDFQFTVAPTGEIVSGGGPAVPPPVLPAGEGLGLPGFDRYLATLPGHPVSPGDTWTKTVTQPNPVGQGTYTTESRFLRYENLKGGRAAVIETSSRVPVDLTFDLPALALGIGSPGSPSPRGPAAPSSRQVHLRGTSSTVSTTWFDTATDHVKKMTSVDTSDLTTSDTGARQPVTVKEQLEFDLLT